jgi:predicted nucleic acid-binding protein
MIVVDTTVWIDFFRAKDTDQTIKLRRLIGRELILIGDIVLVEILQGVRDDAQAARVEQALRAHRVEAMLSTALAPKVASNYRLLRAKGITVRKTIAMIIGTFSIEGGHTLLHADRDFEPMRDHLRLSILY